MKQSEKTLVMLGALVVLVWGFGTNWTFGGLSMGGGGGGGGGTNEQIGADCSPGIDPVAIFSAYWVDPTANNKDTQVATTWNIIKEGDTSAFSSGTTGTSGKNITTKGLLSCGDRLFGVMGDGGATTYYYAASDVATVSKSTVSLGGAKGIEVVKSGAATVYFNNRTTTGAAAVNISNSSTIWGAAGGGSDSSIKMTIYKPTGGKYFGDLGYAICFIYNSGNFSAITPGGYVGQVSVAHVKATSTLDTVACYDMGTSELLGPNGGSKDVSITMQAKSGVVPSAGTGIATSVDVKIVDKTNDLFNGALVPGFDKADGTQSDIGYADVSKTTAISIGTTGD
jgi:hypothetical protein